MARTRKSTLALNLYKYDVLIEDQGVRSDYFKISQFDGYFYGGRNAFLIAGAGVLRPNSKILVEILNKDGKTVYSAPVPQFIEGNSRLVQVEVYSDTPIGPGKIVVLGCADFYQNGTPIPAEWRNKFNVRWTTDVIISPRVENKTPIRFVKSPTLLVEEKFYLEPSSSAFTQRIQVPLDIKFEPIYANVFPNGYLLKVTGPTTQSKFISDYASGVITGSLTYVNSTTTESLNVSLPVTRIFNEQLAESKGSLLYTQNKTLILNGFFSSSQIYSTELDSLGTVLASGSLSLEYDKLETFNKGYSISYAKIRIVNLSTLSGEIRKVRLSYKPTSEPGEYIVLGDIKTEVNELFTVDSASTVVETGKFDSNLVISNYWYTATMSLQKNQIDPMLPAYYNSSSLITRAITSSHSDLLNAINVTPPIVSNKYVNDVSYFVGNRSLNYITLFPNSEYTLTLDAIVNRYSSSIELVQSDYSMEVYLVSQETVGSRILNADTRGQLIGVLTPNSGFTKQNFENTQINFIPNIKESTSVGIRFVVYGGMWSLANVSLKTATEPFFSPDEVDVLIPTVNYRQKILTFKADYLDINNNSVGVSTLSLPTYFTGSQLAVSTGGTSVVIDTIPPLDPAIGDLWWNSEEGQLKIYYADGDSYQWVDASGESLESGSIEVDNANYAISSSYAVTASYYNVPANLRTSTIGVVIDDGGGAITIGEKAEMLIPFNCTIQAWALLADRSGSATVEIWKSTYALYPPTSAGSIVGSAKPNISANMKNTSSTLTGWTTNINKNDTLKFYVSESSTIQRLNLTLEVLRPQ
jgi:hypothetical protein